MKQFFEEYGGVVIVLVVVAALILIIGTSTDSGLTQKVSEVLGKIVDGFASKISTLAGISAASTPA